MSETKIFFIEKPYIFFIKIIRTAQLKNNMAEGN